MINNTRLPSGHRLAVLLTNLAHSDGKPDRAGEARITLLAFPEAYASLKERPFWQDIVQRLQKETEVSGESPGCSKASGAGAQ